MCILRILRAQKNASVEVCERAVWSPPAIMATTKTYNCQHRPPLITMTIHQPSLYNQCWTIEHCLFTSFLTTIHHTQPALSYRKKKTMLDHWFPGKQYGWRLYTATVDDGRFHHEPWIIIILNHRTSTYFWLFWLLTLFLPSRPFFGQNDPNEQNDQ